MSATTATPSSDDKKMKEMFRKVFKRMSAQSSKLLEGWVETALKLNPDNGRAEPVCGLNYEDFGSAETVMRVIFDAFGEVVFQNGCGVTEDALCMDIENRLIRLIDRISPGFDFVFAQALSEEKYESQATGGLRIIICPSGLSDNYLRGRGATLFKTSCTKLSLENVHSIRKQLSMAKDPTALIARGDRHGYCSIGIGPREELCDLPYIDFGERAVWSFCPGTGNQEFRYERGRLGLPQISLEHALDAWIKGQNQLQNIKTIVDVIKKQKHGTVAIVASKKRITGEVDRLASMNRAYKLNVPVGICDSDYEDKILSMTAPDGALMFDFNGNCYAFGAILDGKAKIKGDISRGARYNSSSNYLRQFGRNGKSIVGVIVSEDGMIDLLS